MFGMCAHVCECDMCAHVCACGMPMCVQVLAPMHLAEAGEGVGVLLTLLILLKLSLVFLEVISQPQIPEILLPLTSTHWGCRSLQSFLTVT